MKKLIIIVISLCIISLCQGRIITVDDDGIADFNSIQSAVDSANDGDIIIVQLGLYDEDINFLGKNITLTSTNPTNPNVVKETSIGQDVNEAIITFRGTEDANCYIIGFNINGAIYGFDRTVDPFGENHTHASISHCVFQGNYGSPTISSCDGLITNCLIADNLNIGRLSAVVYPAISDCYGLIKNCTVANNYCSQAVQIVQEGGQTTVENCIIYGNYVDIQIVAFFETTVNIRYSNIQGGLGEIWGGGTVNWGPGNIDADPCFVREGYWDFNEPKTVFKGNYHLPSEVGRWDPNISNWVIDTNTSECIDSGNPGCLVGSEPESNGNRINMGAYGGTAIASKSPADWRSVSDMTNDWVVDFNDMAVLLSYWLDAGECIPGDLNRDQFVDFNDFAILADDWE